MVAERREGVAALATAAAAPAARGGAGIVRLAGATREEKTCNDSTSVDSFGSKYKLRRNC